MRPRLGALVRENALWALLAGAGTAAMAWLGLYEFAWTDYETEAQPAFGALTHGHVLEFLRLAPAYGGSLVERAPFALLPGLWGGGQLAVYRMVALPCLLAIAALGVWLCAQMRNAGRPTLWQGIVLGVCVINPLTLQALEQGHPEELLGAAMCVAAVLLAARGRSIWAAVLLGLAIANKEWALLALGPVLLALPTRPGEPRWRPVIICLLSTCAVTGVVLAPLMLASGGGFTNSAHAVAVSSGTLFQPWRAFWFFGSHGALVYRDSVAMHGYRTGPTWASTISHPLIIVAGLSAAVVLWLQRRRTTGVRELGEHDALLLLAFVLLLRCLLDTWDIGYYMLPCLIALITWEAVGERRRPPILALVGIVLPWLSLKSAVSHGASPDLQAALFLAWTLPLGTLLGLRLYAPELTMRIKRKRFRPRAQATNPSIPPTRVDAAPLDRPGAVSAARLTAAHEITVSSLESRVSTS
jgi:Glycosyltransferase family 87